MTGLARPRGASADLPRFSLQRDTTPVRIAAALRAEIAKGVLTPGMRIPEVEFTAAFDVSRHTLREAIGLLVAEGLLTRASFKGVEVTRLSAEDVSDIYATRRMIELSAVDALPGAPREAWDALLASIDDIAALPEDVGGETMNEADIRVHMALVAVHGSKRILSAYASAMRESQVLLVRAYPPEDVVSSRANHAEFGRLLQSGEIGAARAQLERRLRRSERQMIAALAP